MSRRRRSRGGGAPLVPIGLLLAVLVLVATAGGPTAAFTSGTLARGSTAAVADDASGFLGLDVAGSLSAGSSSRLVTVTNQLDQSLTVEVVSADASVSLSNAQATLSPGESLITSATVNCDAPPETATVTVTAAAGSQFSGTATRSTAVDTTDCTSGSGPFAVVPGSASAGTFSGPGGGPTGSVAFAIENTRSAAVTITDFELVTAGDATALSFDGPPPENGEPGKDEMYIDATGGATSSDGVAENGKKGDPFAVGDGTSYGLDQQVTVDAGESATVSLYQFLRNGTPYTFQSGDEVTVAFTVQGPQGVTRTTVTVTV